MTSQILRLFPPSSGARLDVKTSLGDVVIKSQDKRTRRHRHQQCASKRHEQSRDEVLDEDKENIEGDQRDGSQLKVSDERLDHYSKYLGAVVDSYLSPLKVNAPVRPPTGWFYNVSHDVICRSVPTCRVDVGGKTLTLDSTSAASSSSLLVYN